MATENFEWDTFLESASYRDVLNLSPMLQAGRVPTMYSPGKSELYISTLDVAVATDDADHLDRILKSVVSRFHDHRTNGYDRGCFAARIEIVELCNILSGISFSPEKYLDPDLMMEQKPVG